MMRTLLILFFFSLLSLPAQQSHAVDFESFFHKEPLEAPSYYFVDKTGKRYNLTQFKGKVILLNIWATWCMPCKEEMPALDNLQKNGKEHGIFILPVAIDNKSVDEIQQFYERIGVKYLPVLKDFRRGYFELGVQGLPSTIILNRKGQEVARVTGAIDWDSPSILKKLKDLK